jgi:pimeloyl-ACP methyl ester carboxylesterase
MFNREKSLTATSDLLFVDVEKLFDRFAVVDTEVDYEADEVERNTIPNFDEFENRGEKSLELRNAIYDLSEFSDPMYTLFVHGWNNDDFWQEATADTAFKRLYWQGYQGRFGAFYWPAMVDSEGPIQYGMDWLNATFNPSEFNAYRSAPVLLNLLQHLNEDPEWSRYHNNVNLIGHSQGNMIASETLRLWADHSDAPLVNNYIAMNAAVSAGAYGSNNADLPAGQIDEWGGNINYVRSWPAGRPVTLSDPPFFRNNESAAKSWSNYFLESDAALDLWRVNNSVKLVSPHYIGVTGGTTWPFYYSRDVGEESTAHKRYSLQRGWRDIARFVDGASRTAMRIIPGGIPIVRAIPSGDGARLLRKLQLNVNNELGADAYEVLSFSGVSAARPLGKGMDLELISERKWSRLNTTAHGLEGIAGSLGFGNHSFQFHYSAVESTSYWAETAEQLSP